MKKKRLCWLVGIVVGMMACQSPIDESACDCCEEEALDALEFVVVTKASMSGAGSQETTSEEACIKELFIYAFDDVHDRPDFYHGYPVAMEQPTSAIKVVMSLSGMGWKRFYLLANPPQYIKEKLTPDCKEGLLSSLSIHLQFPIQQMQQLPQSADGSSNPGDTGFPMANQMCAYVHRGQKVRQLYLSATEDETGKPITQIPIFRALGKLTVTARKQAASQEDLYVTHISLFNYTCDGYFIPKWEMTTGTVGPKKDFWEVATGNWKTDVRMDLPFMSKQEMQVAVEPVVLLNREVLVTSLQPQWITSRYLCQNSYGTAMKNEDQMGVTDVEGNRTSQLVVALSDGRKNVIPLPYLRRNDHLKVNLVIAANVVKVEFLRWKQGFVTPDWDDGVVHAQPEGV